MPFKLILNLVLAIVVVKCDNNHMNSSINVRNPNDKIPNICHEHYIDSAFSNHKYQIQVTRKDWIWTYSEKEKKLEKPEKQNPSKYCIKNQIYIKILLKL